MKKKSITFSILILLSLFWTSIGVHANEDGNNTEQKKELTYEITTQIDENGSISKGGMVNRHDTYTVTFSAKEGYKIGQVLDNDKEVNKISLRDGSTAFYVVQNVVNDHRILVKTEVDESQWATVHFVDFDGKVLATQKLIKGKSATPPEVPLREGYQFVGWDKDFTKIDADIKITALYEAEAAATLVEPAELTPAITPPSSEKPQVPPMEKAPQVAFVEEPPILQTPIIAQESVPEMESIAPQETPKSGGSEELEKIPAQRTPKASAPRVGYSLLNLMASIFTVLVGVYVALSKNHDEFDSEEDQYRILLTKIFVLLVAIVSIASFIITQDMSLSMNIGDEWTVIFVILLVLQIVTCVAYKNWKNEGMKIRMR